MVLSGKVDDGARPVLSEKAGYQSGIADVAKYEDVPCVVLQANEVLETARVSELVEWLIRLVQPVDNEVAADKSSTSCNRYAH